MLEKKIREITELKSHSYVALKVTALESLLSEIINRILFLSEQIVVAVFHASRILRVLPRLLRQPVAELHLITRCVSFSKRVVQRTFHSRTIRV